VTVGTQVGTGEATTIAALCEALKAPIEGGADGTDEVGAAVTTSIQAGCNSAGADAKAYKPIK
jgi:hypothetical protein